jgi:hypothetical protein
MDTTELDQICSAIQRAWDEGCPVAPSDHAAQEKTARIALRRWRSWQRRRVKPDLEARVSDLTKGLIETFCPDPIYVGPLKTDWEYLARSIAPVLVRLDTHHDGYCVL